MPAITLPDGSRREYDNPVTIADIAANICPGIAKAALVGKVDGKMVNVSPTNPDTELFIITKKGARPSS